MADTQTFKIYFKDGDIRRFTIPSEPRQSWEEFTVLLMSLFTNADGEFHPELRIQYVDSEGDKITITCQEEWGAALDHLSGSADNKVIKLYISEGNGVYFKDSAPPQPLFVYKETKEGKGETQTNVIDQGPEMESLGAAVPECLQHLFPGQKILPHNLPVFLRDAVKVKKVFGPAGEPTNEVDLDVDVGLLFDKLHRRGLDFLNAKEYEKGLASLKDAAAVFPSYSIAHYNVACAEALCGLHSEAVLSLRKAHACGYSNWDHMLVDEDLDSLRAREDYQSLLRDLGLFQDPVPEPEGWKKKEEEKKLLESLATLETMGFSNKTKNVVLLVKHKGDILAVVKELLSIS